MCAKCGSGESSEGLLYPWGWKHKKSNRISLCPACWTIFKNLRGKVRKILNKVEREDSCLCCEDGYKKEYEDAKMCLDMFIEHIVLTDAQRQYI